MMNEDNQEHVVYLTIKSTLSLIFMYKHDLQARRNGFKSSQISISARV